ncbi:MAG: LysE family translocator [Alphaproteobacteria bacterium]|jgi:threonine/homoserine/homoserine lactone efflux protein|nr:lysine transporter LysE [Rhodospirillaceae bacterium]MDP6407645.1 LysE family translocator [Alphaproteobacteria bacterium]MDP6621296.1 LysE family translocator [Alphaproteobacteria bacterium]MDP7429265.1 LysE family translocator [Alphaproteobacteria bacterium]MDP7604111.1 LysE family translocator [Alphaproteobacteria bacterium]|tara:strand:+ start:1107 stop:1718 length:612 start_codon:yes stop_codon:yes gene_type:complete
MSAEFLLTSLIVVLVPGIGVAYTLSCGLFRGRLASVVAAFGCTMGILPHMAAGVFGLAALLHASALAFQVVKFAGVAYLIYLAWGIWRDTGTLKLAQPEGAAGLGATAVRGFLINILNPKLSIFFLAFLPQFVAADAARPVAQMLGLGAVFMLMTLVIFVIYGLAAASVRTYVISSPGVMNWCRRGFAATFAALATKLALTEA